MSATATPRTTATYRWADQATKGRLVELLAEWKQADLSYEKMRDRLRDDYGVEVSTTTVYRWFQPEPETAA